MLDDDVRKAPIDAAKLASVLDETPDLICRFKPDTTLTYVNRAYSKTFGQEPRDLVGKRFLDLIPETDRPAVLEHLASVSSDRPKVTYTHSAVSGSGETVWQMWTDMGFFSDDGELVELQAIGRDVSEIVRLQLDLAARNATIEKQDRELTTILNLIPARVWYKDDENRILRLNKAAADSMNISIRDGEGADTYALFPEMAKKYHDDDLRVIESGEPELGIIERYTPADGKHGWSSTDKIPLYDEATEKRSILVISHDITDLKDKEDRLLDANERLRHFASAASHDLQSPVRQIALLTEMFKDMYAGDLGNDAVEHLERIENLARRSRDLIRALAEFSAMSARTANLSEVDLTEIAKASAEELRMDADEAGIAVVISELGMAYADSALMPRVFSNLIANSIRYNNNPQPMVTINASTNQGIVEVTVEDNGPGFPLGSETKLFEPFTRLTANQGPGNGLGLALCRTIVQACGGQIWADFTAERGARICFTLPRQA